MRLKGQSVGNRPLPRSRGSEPMQLLEGELVIRRWWAPVARPRTPSGFRGVALVPRGGEQSACSSACALATAHVPTSLRHLRIGRRRRRRRLRSRGKSEAPARGPLGVGAPTPVTLGEGPMGHRQGGVLSARTSACACLPTLFLHLRLGRRRGGKRVGLREDDTSVRDFLEVGAPVLISPLEGKCEGPKGPSSPQPVNLVQAGHRRSYVETFGGADARGRGLRHTSDALVRGAVVTPRHAGRGRDGD